MYKERETDLVGKEIKAVEIKNKNITLNKLKKEIGGQLTKIKIYKSRAAIRRTTKNI